VRSGATARRAQAQDGEVVIPPIRAIVAAVAAGALMLSGRTADGQDTSSVPCAGQRIEDVIIYAAAPTAAVMRRVPVVHRFVAAIHTTTHPSVIERFLLLKRGDAC